MDKKISNPCTRCGTERIVVKTWEEKVGNSTVVNIETVCPNPECQKKVNSDNKKQHDKYMTMKLKHERRMSFRKTMTKKPNLKAKVNH